jgi:hypothetical protein
VVDRYFLENRAKLIDIAGFLDRTDRAAGPGTGDSDFRIAALHQALDVLRDGQGERAKRVLSVFSDQTVELPESAAGVKGTSGAAHPGEVA